MNDQIILHEADGSRRGFVSPAEAEVLARAGKGFGVHSRRGKLVRFVLFPRSSQRVYFDAREGLAALHGCSRTTRAVRADGSGGRGAGQLIGNPRMVREHKPVPNFS